MDLSIFSNPHFDPNEYANAILAGEPYVPHQPSEKPAPTTLSSKADTAAKEDISLAIFKLSSGIDDVSKQIKTVVAAHHEDLLAQAANANSLSSSMVAVRSGLDDLDSSLRKTRSKVRTPYHALQMHVTRLGKVREASEVLRRMSRFVVLARRLQIQMRAIGDGEGVSEQKEGRFIPATNEQDDGKERMIVKAALSISELAALIDGPSNTAGDLINSVDNPETDTSRLEEDASPTISLRDVNAISAHIPFIEDSRAKVNSQMESMIMNGLTTNDQPVLAAALQTAFNLHVLPNLVQRLVQDLSEAVEQRIQSAFDLNKIARDAIKESPGPHQSKNYKSRVRTEPTNITALQWTSVLWARLESLIEEMAICCIKVFTLEKVLKVKKDPASQTVFLDEAMKLLENKPSTTFWLSLGKSLETNAKESAKSSTFLQQTLIKEYPKLLRLFQNFFEKIAVHTDTVYTQAQRSPETTIVLRAFSDFEALYVTRHSTRVNEAISQAFSGGARSHASLADGINIARLIANELDSARFDPLLVRAVAKGAVTSIDMATSRADALVSKDRAAVSLAGPAATSQQISNGQVGTCLYHLWERLTKLEEEHDEHVYAILQPSITNMKTTFDKLVDPLLAAIRRELEIIINRLHRIDFSKPFDPAAGSGASSYMKDLVEKLNFIKTEVLSQLNVAEAGRDWVKSIGAFVMRTFALHISIAKPLGESGKLQMTTDMTELEFALSAFLVEGTQSKRGGNLEGVGDGYKILRAMRPLLFLENSQLASSQHTVGLPPLIVLHHILVRSPVPLPHALHSWQEAEYVRWVDGHSEDEVWTLVEGSLAHWQKIAESEGKDTREAMEYVHLARRVLANARSR